MTTIELLAAGWAAATVVGLCWLLLRARHAAQPAPRLPHAAGPACVPAQPPEETALPPFASRELDVEREFGAAISALRDLAAENMKELQVMLQPGLKIWSDPYALRQLLVEVMTHAIGRAPGGSVLLCALARRSRSHHDHRRWSAGRSHATEGHRSGGLRNVLPCRAERWRPPAVRCAAMC